MKRDIKEIEEEWDSLSDKEKNDIFLWKMIWYHSERHTPGSPSKPIWDLSKIILEATKSSDKLTKSIRIATWVGGIAATVGVVVAIIALFIRV